MPAVEGSTTRPTPPATEKFDAVPDQRPHTTRYPPNPTTAADTVRPNPSAATTDTGGGGGGSMTVTDGWPAACLAPSSSVTVRVTV